LGNFALEPLQLRAADLIHDRQALAGLTTVAALLRLLPERDPHRALFEALGVVLEHLDDPNAAGALIVRFELALLAELGFGLDLSACAATGGREELAFVSPRSGRAVSATAGAPWRAKLLNLPAFLSDGTGGRLPSQDDIAEGFRLTGFFLDRHVYGPRGLDQPEARARFIAGLSGRNPVSERAT
jgi:DNA repair protein RecO (recombination protein O)